MQSQIRRVNTTSFGEQGKRRSYEKPAVIFQGKITIRAGSPVGGRFGPPGGPDTLFDS